MAATQGLHRHPREPRRAVRHPPLPHRRRLVEHLLDHLVDALIGANPPRERGDEHPFRPVRRWDPGDAERWLAFLAHHLTTIGSRDLAWWHLHRATPRLVAPLSGLVAGLVVGTAWGLHDGISYGLANGVAVGSVLGLVYGIAVAVATGLTVWLVFGLLFGLSVLAAGVGAGLVAGQPGVGLAFAIVGGVPTMFVVGLAVRGIGFTPAHVPAYADLRLRGRVGSLARRLVRWDDGRLMLRFVPGFAIGFAYGIVLDAAGVVPNGLVTGLVDGLVFGLAALCAIGLTDWAETPLTDGRPQTPTITFRGDLRLVQVKSLAGGFAFGLAFGIVERLSVGAGLSLAALFALALALGVGPHQPSGKYIVTVMALGVQRRIPLRLLHFLDDAHRLGILRQVGPVYQFRHAKLQDRLAHAYPRASAARAPTPVSGRRGGS